MHQALQILNLTKLKPFMVCDLETDKAYSTFRLWRNERGHGEAVAPGRRTRGEELFLGEAIDD